MRPIKLLPIVYIVTSVVFLPTWLTKPIPVGHLSMRTLSLSNLAHFSYIRGVLLLLISLVLLSSHSSFAAATNVVSRITKGVTKPKISNQPEIIGTVDSTNTIQNGKPARPGGVNDGSPATVNALINKLQTDRQSFLAAQKEIRLKQASANSEEARALLRQEMNDALQKWKAERTQFVEEQRERAKSIRSELHPDMGRVVDGAIPGSDSGRGR